MFKKIFRKIIFNDLTAIKIPSFTTEVKKYAQL